MAFPEYPSHLRINHDFSQFQWSLAFGCLISAASLTFHLFSSLASLTIQVLQELQATVNSIMLRISKTWTFASPLKDFFPIKLISQSFSSTQWLTVEPEPLETARSTDGILSKTKKKPDKNPLFCSDDFEVSTTSVSSLHCLETKLLVK